MTKASERINLTTNDVAVLRTMSGYGEDCYLAFDTIAADSSVERRSIRRIVRRLARAGYAQFAKGLSDEDGKPAGAGYAITASGTQAVENSSKAEPAR